MEQAITWSALGLMTTIMLAGFTMLAGRIDAVGAESAARDSALSGRIDALDTKLSGRIDAVGAESAERDSALGARIDALDANLTARIDSLDANLTARIDATNARIDGSNGRIDQILFAINPPTRRANG